MSRKRKVGRVAPRAPWRTASEPAGVAVPGRSRWASCCAVSPPRPGVARTRANWPTTSFTATKLARPASAASARMYEGVTANERKERKDDFDSSPRPSPRSRRRGRKHLRSLYYNDASLCSFGKELAATARNERGKSRKRTERGQLYPRVRREEFGTRGQSCPRSVAAAPPRWVLLRRIESVSIRG